MLGMNRVFNFRFLWALLKDSANGFVDNCALRLSAALSYYSVFSLAPLLILAIGLASMMFDDQVVRGQVSLQLKNYMGTTAARGVEGMIESTRLRGDGWTATVVGCVALLIGASGVFGQLKDALNTIWEVKTKPGRGLAAFMRDRLLSFGMILVIGFLLLVSLLVTTLLASVTQYTRVHIDVPDAVWSIVNLTVSLLVSSVLFAAIFKILPDVRVPWRTVSVGAVATAILFELGKFGLAFYLGRESTASPFGAAGSVVLVLLWVYYAAAILLFGAELTRAFARQTGTRIELGRFAEPITAREQTKEGLQPTG
jgi:membrane protein